MPVLIPIEREADGPSFFTVQAPLEDVVYTISFRWNVRAPRTSHDGTVSSGAWFYNVLDVEGVEAFLVGQPLVTDFPATKNISGRTPAGVIVAVDTAAPFGDGIDPGFDDLGNRHQVYYFTAAEAAALGA